MKLRELVEQIGNLKCKLEVYREIFIFLQEFISTDNREAKKSIGFEGFDSQFVPDYIIEEVIANIEQDYIRPLETQIKELEERTI